MEPKKRKKRKNQASSDPKLNTETNTKVDEPKPEKSLVESNLKPEEPKVPAKKRKLEEKSATLVSNKAKKMKKQKTVASPLESKSIKVTVEKKQKIPGKQGKDSSKTKKNAQAKPFKKDRRPVNRNKTQEPLSDISENRLRAFGINPKRFFNKLKYGPNSQHSKKVSQNGDNNKKKFDNKKKGKKSGKTSS